MKWSMLVLILLAAGPALAEDQEPAILTKARKDYDAKTKAAVDPIKADYLKKLDGLKKGVWGRRGFTVSRSDSERDQQVDGWLDNSGQVGLAAARW